VKRLGTHVAAFALGLLLAATYFLARHEQTADEQCPCEEVGPPTEAGPGAVAVQVRPADDANVTRLQQRIDELEAKVAASQIAEAAAPEAALGVRYFGLSKEELVELARNCDVRTDTPAPMSDELAADADLTDDEREAYNRAYERWQAAHYAAKAAIYEEATGEKPDGPAAMMGIMVEFYTDADRDVDRHIAEERAGLREPPGPDAELGIYERFKRLSEGRGDAFERELAKELGPDRARALRAINDGWPGGRQRHWGCPEDGE